MRDCPRCRKPLPAASHPNQKYHPECTKAAIRKAAMDGFRAEAAAIRKASRDARQDLIRQNCKCETEAESTARWNVQRWRLTPEARTALENFLKLNQVGPHDIHQLSGFGDAIDQFEIGNQFEVTVPEPPEPPECDWCCDGRPGLQTMFVEMREEIRSAEFFMWELVEAKLAETLA